MHIMDLGKACLFLDSKAIYFYIDVKVKLAKIIANDFLYY